MRDRDELTCSLATARKGTGERAITLWVREEVISYANIAAYCLKVISHLEAAFQIPESAAAHADVQQ